MNDIKQKIFGKLLPKFFENMANIYIHMACQGRLYEPSLPKIKLSEAVSMSERVDERKGETEYDKK